MSRARWATLLLGAGLALRVAYAWRAHGMLPTEIDSYETIALNVLHGQGYAIDPGVPTAQREPGYPLLIAACYLLGRRPWLVLALQCALSTATAWIAWRLGRRLGGERAGLAALVICAFHPQLIYYCAYFFRDTWLAFLFATLCLASTLWSARAGDPSGDAAAAAGGMAAALLGLSNSAHLPALALAGALLWRAAPAAARVRRVLLYALPLVLGFGLWTARNALVFGRFVPGSTHGGEEFYQALIVPPDDLGTHRQVEIIEADPVFLGTRGLGEAERAQAFTAAGLRWIAAHPAAYAGRALAGVVKFWRPWPYRRQYQHSYATLVAASLLSDGWLVPLGLFALWSWRSRWRQLPAAWAGAVGLTFLYGAVHAVIRYRLPLIAPLAALAAAEADRRWRGARA